MEPRSAWSQNNKLWEVVLGNRHGHSQLPGGQPKLSALFFILWVTVPPTLCSVSVPHAPRLSPFPPYGHYSKSFFPGSVPDLTKVHSGLSEAPKAIHPLLSWFICFLRTSNTSASEMCMPPPQGTPSHHDRTPPNLLQDKKHNLNKK